MNLKDQFPIHVDFIVVLIIIFAVVVVGWRLWYEPARDKIAINAYKIAMNSMRSMVESCDVSGGKILSGKPGNPICQPNTAGTYLDVMRRCNPEPPNYAVIKIKNGGWILTTQNGNNEPWSCRGCSISCSQDKCETRGNCY
ncbi:MAG: hypothetical protein A3J63_02155 [Candidatus Moranbacteria bacterium RIFCSPHIGHO2_02_FULL_40_12b]|nr:MAG: hypothetical protein A3J63_02155 [Candidatus Moranbacteria bacterium RIFCSPHIGHO2_02_FULL_40_12b]